MSVRVRTVVVLLLSVIATACDDDPAALDPRPAAAVQLALGVQHTCALDAHGRLFCWGSNRFGALGLEELELFAEPQPTRRAGVAHVAAAGAYTCILNDSGAAFCWGLSADGALGAGGKPSASPVLQPVPVAGDLRFATLAGGATSACALTLDSLAWCWGNDELGQLGNDTGGAEPCGITVCAPAPQRVAGDLRFRVLSVGRAHACALTADGAAWCWGSNEHGQAGWGAAGPVTCASGISCAPAPVPVAGDLRFASIAAGGTHTCAVAVDGAAWCWGSNTAAQLGTHQTGSCNGFGPGRTNCAPAPVPVAGGLHFTAVTAGGSSTCALTGEGAAWCWGVRLETVPGERSYQPVAVAANTRFDEIVMGETHVCAIATDGTPWCWGVNSYGQAGTGALDQQTSDPAPVEWR